MSRLVLFCVMIGCAAGVNRGVGQPVLSIDFNFRASNPATVTQAGFDSFVIGTTDGTGIQTNATTRTFGAISVTVSGNGSNPGYDDRDRGSPPNNGAFTQGLLLRDFVFSRSIAADQGLNILIEGLNADAFYEVRLWSFDSSSGGRTSDWDANGIRVWDNYTTSTTPPTSNTQYQFSFKIPADSNGRILIEGRKDPVTVNNFAVFLNALQVEPSAADPPIVTVQPSNIEVYTGDNVVFRTLISGTPPFTFQWRKDGNDIMHATNRTHTVFGAMTTDLGAYSVVVSNSVGSVTSAVSIVSSVLPVADLFTGLIAHWPMDDATTITPDRTTNGNHLALVEMDATDLVPGYLRSALRFDGVTNLATRAHNGSGYLPLSVYPAYSVALWVKGDFTNQIDRRVFAESANTNNTPLFTIGTHRQASNGVVDIYIRNNNNTIPIDHRQSSLIAFDDTWHHIVWVDNNSYPTLYVDGVADTNDFNYTRSLLTPNVVTVGGLQRANPGNWFKGDIDQVAGWRRSLSPVEVQEVFSSGPPEALRIVTVEVSGGNVTLTIRTPDTGLTHHIEEATSLGPPVWTEVENVALSGTGDTLTAQFTIPGGDQRFYRVTY